MSSSNRLEQQQQQNEPFLLRATNVSSPSIIHNKASQQSITASEDYYSLSGSSNYSGEEAIPAATLSASQYTIRRVDTPPELYRTPMQSALNLPQQPQSQAHEYALADDEANQPFRKTPMRGQGKRRSSGEEHAAVAALAPAAAGPSASGTVRRKPVPNSPTGSQRTSATARPVSQLSATQARSSVARGFDREDSPPTPDLDDTPYVHFALDQLTRDEEVRGSRRYLGSGRDSEGNYPYLTPLQVQQQQEPLAPQKPAPVQQQQLRSAFAPQQRPAYAALGQEEEIEKELEQQPQSSEVIPPRSPNRESRQIQPLQPSPNRPAGPNLFVPVTASKSQALRAYPGILRPLALGLFTLLVLAYAAALIVAAVWSRINTGLTPYGTFGDWKYFIFRFLPILLGMILFYWLVQIEVAVYRIAPFIAMTSSSPRTRAAGAKLPLQPRGFVLPYSGHFRSAQPVVALFLLIAWLQIFTIPLLAASFNVYFETRWTWLAVQAAIWAVVGLYILLALALLALLIWLARVPSTGLKWDARSLADMIVLFERSNALSADGSAQDEETPRLGLWRTTHRPNEVFHAFGVSDRSPRTYAVGEDGRIREKLPVAGSSAPPSAGATRYGTADAQVSRFSEASADMEIQRSSHEAILPRRAADASQSDKHGHVLPWYLRSTLAVLWPIISIVLLLAFLIVSYLSVTDILAGFLPQTPSIVDHYGFSAGNFLYSIMPAFLGMLCVLFWLDLDFAWRRLAPIASLAQLPRRHSAARNSETEKLAAAPQHSQDGVSAGDIPERTLLPSYAATIAPVTALHALSHGHFRVAYIAIITTLNLAVPVLAGGVFWSQFSVPQQRVLIYVWPAAYYALSVFLVIAALSYLAIFPSRSLRKHGREIGRVECFDDIRRLVLRSQIVDDVAFHEPRDRVDLETRLIVGTPVVAAFPAGLRSKTSVADSLRGFMRGHTAVRQQQQLDVEGQQGNFVQPHYAFSRTVSRDGGEWSGIDRVRR